MNDIKWISINDALPPEQVFGESTKYYLLKWEEFYPNFGQGFLYGTDWYADWTKRYCVDVTHWADLEEVK